jgi:small subunit ribosomal protein S4
MISIQHAIDTGKDKIMPEWIIVDINKKTIDITSTPSRNDASSQINEQLIVELYSK